MALATLQPDGLFYVLQNINLNNTYKETYSFPTLAEQTNFFLLKALDNRSLQYKTVSPARAPNTIILPVNANRVLNCDYCMFQNSNYSNKWFYAFITGVEWQSVSSCVLHYEIDVLQSWYFEMRLPPCFVVREHVQDDSVGANVMDENLELGEYVTQNEYSSGLFDEYVYVVAAAFDETLNDAVGSLYSGIYSGLHYNVFETVTAVNSFLSRAVGDNKATGIVSVFMMPKTFADVNQVQANLEPFYVPHVNSGALDGYTPKNNKCYTYPYSFLFCNNMSGGSADFRYEDFQDVDTSHSNQCGFWVFVDFTCNPTAILVPRQYKGTTANWNEKISMDGFPQCAWTTDTFKAWLAQNGSSTAIGMMSSAFSGIGSLLTGNFAGAIGTGFSIAQQVAQVKATESLPPQAHGATASTALVATGHKDFFLYHMTVKKEYMKVIDNYFSMFGYAVHEVKTPRITGRQSWNYIETKECIVQGNLPQTAARQIENIFNNGIRFWHGDWIGQYFRDNSPVSNFIGEGGPPGNVPTTQTGLEFGPAQ